MSKKSIATPSKKHSYREAALLDFVPPDEQELGVLPDLERDEPYSDEEQEIIEMHMRQHLIGAFVGQAILYSEKARKSPFPRRNLRRRAASLYAQALSIRDMSAEELGEFATSYLLGEVKDEKTDARPDRAAMLEKARKRHAEQPNVADHDVTVHAPAEEPSVSGTD